MSENEEITLVTTEKIEKELPLECFRIVLHHEYKINDKIVKIDKPLSIECIMPVGEFFGVPRYNKQNIVRMLSEKLIEDIRGEE